ncbi:hypothetical protein [Candidatus Parabeggiatoa sp. HSG14]|uniref:hypothetical protein n=1 Tax=Candidatus Parabeggiatoa sp. HSG14 TaxID=3055593 RepID=UPI0025A7EC4C|nr:hypothetical protein [Thiotrichales bacterium HSG14]
MKRFKYWFASTIFILLLSTSVYADSINTLQKQILAEAICVALNPSANWTFAVARNCELSSPPCEQVCAGLSEEQAGNLKCFNSLHIYGNSPFHNFNDFNQLGLKVFKYNSCSGGACGPNYCCCSGWGVKNLEKNNPSTMK